ncbi:MAG: hypothetical protein R2751_16890 [Bacteroidales bacterium]
MPTSIEIWNLRIDEPMTVLTDLLLAAICFYAYLNIRHVESPGRIKRYFKYYFLTLGFGSLFGGVLGHAFLYQLPDHWKLLSWMLVLLSVVLISLAMLEMARPLINPSFTRIIQRLNMCLFILAAFFTVWNVAFSPVKYYTIFGMVLIVGMLSVHLYRKTGNRALLRLTMAVGVGLVSAVIFSYQWGLGPWFNHNDISHVILSFSTVMIYKGASLLLNSSPLI